MRNAPVALLPLLLLAACGGGESDPVYIQNAIVRVADVVLDTVASTDGTLVHGPGEGLGGGPTCGRIIELNGYRTDQAVVFRIEDANGFCFDTDVYEIVVDEVDWNGERGALIFANRGDPTDSPNGQVFFVPDGGTAVRVTALHVLQAVDAQVENRLILSIPISQFAFAGSETDTKSVFQVAAQIERFPQGAPAFKPDWTEPVDVDFIDVFPE
jgi:hypothetical protein